MKSILATGLALALASACTSGTKAKNNQTAGADDRLAELEKKVEDIDGRLQRIEQLLEQAMGGSARDPDPNTVYSVPIEGLPYEGADEALLTVVMAYEYACGYCYRARPTLDRLLQEYAGKLKVVYKPFIVHADIAVHPAMAVCAAHKQGKYDTLSDLIWEKGFAARNLEEAHIDALAAEAGLDMEQYARDTKSEACLNELRESSENLARVGVGGTPTFYINGRPIVGAQPIGAFREVLDQELAKAQAALAEGASLSNYYADVVVKGGKTAL